jgi:hypothetical protein
VPQGQTPGVKTPARYWSLNMILAITPWGEVHCMIDYKTMTTSVLLRFVKRLIQDSGHLDEYLHGPLTQGIRSSLPERRE